MTKRECAFKTRGKRLPSISNDPAESHNQITVTALATRLAYVIERYDVLDGAERRAEEPTQRNRLSVLAGHAATEMHSLEKLIQLTPAKAPDEELMQMILTLATLDLMGAEEVSSTEEYRARSHLALSRLVADRRATSALPRAIFAYYGRSDGNMSTADQHQEWWSEIQRLYDEEGELLEQQKDKEVETVRHQRWELLNLISSTPALSVDGLYAQATCLAEFFLEESRWTDKPDQKMARNLAATLATLRSAA